MTARDVIAEALNDALNGWRYIRSTHGDLYGVGWERVEGKLMAALESTLAQPSWEAVDLWREVERAPCSDGCCGGCCFVRVEHPTTPPAPLGGLTEGEWEALQRLESRLTNGDFYSDYDNDWALVGKLREVIRRLTAPRAEGVDARDAARWRWLRENVTFMEVDADFPVDGPNIPVLAQVSSRIWYHATDNITATTVDELADAALTAAAPKVESPRTYEDAIRIATDPNRKPAAAPQAEAGEVRPAGHCESDDVWRQFSADPRYSSASRDGLTMGDLSDFELANAQYLAHRTDPMLTAYQTAAKERIRWLSVQLAQALAQGGGTAEVGRVATEILHYLDGCETPDAEAHATVGELRAWAHRLLAALAPQRKEGE